MHATKNSTFSLSRMFSVRKVIPAHAFVHHPRKCCDRVTRSGPIKIWLQRFSRYASGRPVYTPGAWLRAVSGMLSNAGGNECKICPHHESAVTLCYDALESSPRFVENTDCLTTYSQHALAIHDRPVSGCIGSVCSETACRKHRPRPKPIRSPDRPLLLHKRQEV
ncbi:MAG: hypothetical protein BWZ01_01959 [Deltaproteobacteria bacterium ADurb.BinA179]|jgi:hypothetical protein|nr:MAG: hypothetical protein BWZ01_01959 [Deltaproteobacteria bacterium ADurb.BinA179]